MNGTGYVYKGERWFKYLFEIFIFVMIIMGKHDPANWKFIITIIVILFGALFRIFSSRRAIFVQAKKRSAFTNFPGTLTNSVLPFNSSRSSYI